MLPISMAIDVIVYVSILGIELIHVSETAPLDIVLSDKHLHVQ